MVNLVLLVLVDVLVTKDLLVLQVQWVHQVDLAFLVHQERLVLLDLLVKGENVARVDLLVSLDHQACQVNQDHLVFKAHLAKQANVVERALKVTED